MSETEKDTILKGYNIDAKYIATQCKLTIQLKETHSEII